MKSSTADSQIAAVESSFPGAAADVLRLSAQILCGTLLLAGCAHVAIPLGFTPVPFTLQPFAVMLLSLLMGPRMAAATMAAYLLEGAAGIPVFAPGMVWWSGMAHLLGPTGGYLLAYPAAGWLISTLWRRIGRGFAGAMISAAAGNAFFLVCGAAWLAVWTHISIGQAVMLALAPFLPGECLKIAAAAGIATGLQRIQKAK